jgi:restriction endonuclease S subunit
MKNDIISDTIDHITDEAIAVSAAPLIPPNSVLIVVRSGILQHTVPIAMNTTEVSINQDMRALTPKADVPVIGSFIAVFLKCSQHKLLTQVKWSTTVQSINRESIQDIEIPLPPLKIQKQLIEKVAAQRKVVSELKAEVRKKSRQAKVDIEAMILGTKPVPDAN